MTIDQAINYYKDLKDKYCYVKMKVRLGYLSKKPHFLVLELKKTLCLVFGVLYKIQWN
jgi:hypothetical protein